MRQNIIRFLVYFLSILIVCAYALVMDHYFLIIKQYANATFNILPLILFIAISPILIGMLLKIPHLILNWKETEWGFDWVKFLSIGLITLLFIIHYIMSYFNSMIEMPQYIAFTIPDQLLTVFGVVFGYVLLSCIRYDKTEN
ncbi:hypothetical protein E3U55_10040 [Filobacillus milosensis]|uniref:Uncharacterized protein n=1 Tax=Filobacillus milosensis TaxID=94137 RepID=A0A4Y8IFW0_9BACI|nr:hypothetical protein [Filobacillus milosensis]TFB19497.1 hypothetical protein E3U55_10040 [Filobacillus milosensis]